MEEPALTLGGPEGLTAGVEGLLRERDAPEGGRERYAQRSVAIGWQPWRRDEGGARPPPCDLAVVAASSDSWFTIRDGSTVLKRSGERTTSVGLHAARATGWITWHAGALWSDRFFKIRRVRLNYLSAAAGGWLRLGPLPVSLFVEALPWIANPDGLARPWSAGAAAGDPGHPFLLLFASNVYGSTPANVTSGPGTRLYGVRITAAWTFRARSRPEPPAG